MTVDSWLIWPDQAFLSLLVLLAIALPFLWAARSPMHRALRGLTRLFSTQLRAASRWLLRVAELARQRNREVLVHQAGEELGGVLERELERTEAVVQRELRHFPEVQRRLLDLLADLEEDYQKSMAPPPEPPDARSNRAGPRARPPARTPPSPVYPRGRWCGSGLAQ